MSELAAVLDRGGVLGIPSESSYGLAARPGNSVGVEAVYRAKGRQSGKPLPVVAASIAQVEELGVALEPRTREALGRLWPGAVTVVLPADRAWPATAGIAAIAVRVPDHENLRAVLASVGPLTATSANRADDEPITDPDRLRRFLAGEDAIVIDDGQLPGGPPSTLVDAREPPWRLLRPGRVPFAEVLEACAS